MLRIHIEEKCDSATLRLEGRLAGAWVEELERCCQNVLARRQNRALVIELDGVTFVDEEGQSLLREMHDAGATLVGRGAQCRYLVEQIQQQQTG
jgi:anti-anti-sigma regulatory factor